ncbi:MAG: dipeptide/oligopeptide/nickel ABC transporter ATP-binding protein [Trueperella sp.]|nr:dipeptide/oligopeptide/nickel ABC transporter ATP-binding protein [Trueperella sp.]
MTSLFNLHRVSKSYGSTQALAPLDLTVREGNSLGIIGESGSGKTTLTRLMLGLSRPTSGTVTYRGEEVAAGVRGPSRLRREVQLVLQDPFASLNPRMTIGQIIAEPLRILKIAGDKRERVAEVLTMVDLDPTWASRRPHQLSGGQRQRVAIARAIAPAPKVIIADEPVSALDVSVRVHILELLQRLREENQVTLIVVSHDLGIVQNLCGETMVLFSGNCVEHRPTPQLLADPRNPATRELIAAVPDLPESVMEQENR